MFIGVAGNIGSGKTTLTRMLAQKLNFIPHFEAVQNNPYLSDFYQDMGRYSLPIQVFFLSTRFKAHQDILKNGGSSIQDRTIYEDYHVFSRNLHETGLMDQRDFENYQNLFRIMTPLLRPPDILVYLKKSLPKLMERIALRGRDFEKNMPEEYVARLNDYYEQWAGSYQIGKILVVESDHLDFIHEEKHFEYIVQRIWHAFDDDQLVKHA